MRYLRTPKVLHNGEVHSLDVNSDGSKVLTAGNDSSILVWRLLDFLQMVDQLPTQQTDITEGLQMCEPIGEFDAGCNNVSVVKWCPTNDCFVSAGIDGNINLVNIVTKETKKVYQTQQGQDESLVVDLAWSYDGRLIAWSTGDGRVHLLDIEKNTYQELSTLSNIDKTVIQRSLAFDPTNNYLVTLGDDTVIYLYQYAYDDSKNYQFRLINKISKLVNEMSVNVQFKRVSWSYDGEFISIPTASKNHTSVVSLISRSNEWENKVSLVGHDYNCEVAKFNSKLYQLSERETRVFNIIATAGSDKTLAIWNTSKEGPLLILKDVVDKAIVDLVWNKEGNFLIAGSLSGQLLLLKFEDNEIGTEVKPEIYKELEVFKSQYVKPLNYKPEVDQSSKKSGPQIEILSQKNAIRIEDLGKKAPKEEVAPTNKDDLETPQKDKEIENKPKGDVIPEVPSSSLVKSSTTDILHSAMNNRQSKVSKVQKTKSTKQVQTPDKQKITTVNGKKRVQPTLISNNGSASGNTAINNTSSPLKSDNSSSSKTIMEFDKPSYSVSDSFLKQSKRVRQDDNGNTKKLKRELEPIKFIGSVIQNPNTTFAKVRLSVPKIKMNFQLHSDDDNQALLDIKNGIGNETKPSRVTYFKNEKPVWSDFIPRFIQLATEGKSFWAVSSSEGQIIVYSHSSGKRMLPPFILGSPVSFLESYGSYLMAVTSIGELFVWDLTDCKIHLSTSISPLLDLPSKFREEGLSKSDNITMCALTSKGIPLVALSNGSGFLFNKELLIWQTISESWWAFGSHYWDSNDTKPSNKLISNIIDNETSIIDMLEHKTNEEIIRKSRSGRGKFFNKISKNMMMKEGFENIENTISLSHLENRILCSEILDEKADFKKHFTTYVQRLCELGLKAKLFEICSQLLGPGPNEENVGKWESKICGHDKHELLKEIILLCANHRSSQRILVHFGKKMGIFDEASSQLM